MENKREEHRTEEGEKQAIKSAPTSITSSQNSLNIFTFWIALSQTQMCTECLSSAMRMWYRAHKTPKTEHTVGLEKAKPERRQDYNVLEEMARKKGRLKLGSRP